MLLNQRNGLLPDCTINPLLITDSMLHFHNTKMICSDIDNNLCIMPYEEAKIRELHIVAKLRFDFESEKAIAFHGFSEGHHHKYYHGTFPMFKRFFYSDDSSNIKFSRMNKILENL